MSRARRVGGSGWAGLHGSFIGISKGNASRSGSRIPKKPKDKVDQTKIDLASLPDNQDVQKAGRRVLAVQLDIETTKKRLSVLERQLSLAMNNLEISKNQINPRKGARRPKKFATRGFKK